MRHLSATMSAKNTLWMCVALAATILAAFLVVVLGTPTKPAEAAFPGKNGKIVFTSYMKRGYSEIFTMKPNGDNKTRLTNNIRVDDFDPVFSPNGRQIAFASNRAAYHADIFTMSASGTDKKRVTTSESVESEPAWSPDGTKIAFYGRRWTDSTVGIYVMKAAPESETNRPKRLTGNQRTGGCEPICGRIGEIEPDWQPLR